jgi:class 3 adenylate cyclase/predicted ATPase
LTADHLKEIGITSLGLRLRLLEAIAALRLESPAAANPGAATSPTGNLASTETTAERRPLSVMFCDLIGSTALSSRLDPEDLRQIIRTYQACVANTIQQFDGFIARYVGDGVLIYFGWPEARETDAERAVRAGLAVAAAVGKVPVPGEQLQVRIGIATGLVVIGEPIGSGDSRQQTAVGETPNLAARLQGLAGPNQVVIDAATRRQIGGLFVCQDLGTVELKGLPAAVPAWQVVSANRTLGQFEALRSGSTPLVGRDEEMELLLRRWAQAKSGTGRVVLICAEPGVGKSRLAEALSERIAGEPHTRLRYFCSPHHRDSALYPVIAQMERAAGFVHADVPAVRLAKLQTLLAATAPPVEDVALIAEMNSLPSGDLAPPLDLTPQRKKDKTFEALLRQVEGLAWQKPVLMIFDDIHWIDPSSGELLDRTIERVAGWPVLLLAMFRPEFQPPWIGQPHVTMLTLARLDRSNTAAMVANVAGNAVLSAEVMEEITERTDGVPLFVEELTKAVLEAGEAVAAALSVVPHPGPVPATLHASLMARLDRLGPAAKEVAQTGAAIGREFGYELLAATTDLPEPQLHEALDRLTNAGLLFVRGMPPQSSYIFKHALVQDAAYGTLLRSRRHRLHGRIAEILETDFTDRALNEPDLLAYHYTEAGLTALAINYWEKAGVRAAQRSANKEAIAHLRKGLEQVAELPKDAQRNDRELHLLLALGPALMTTRSSAAPEIGSIYARACQLAQEGGFLGELFPTLWGSWLVAFTSDDLTTANRLSDELFGIARDQASPELLLQAHHAAWPTLIALGELTEAQQHIERGLALYQPDIQHAHAQRYGGHDPGVCGYVLGAMIRAALGFPDEALRQMDQGRVLAESLDHPPSLSQPLWFAADLSYLRRDPRAVREFVSTALPLLSEHGSAVGLANAMMLRGWALINEGRVKEGMADLSAGLSRWRTSGSKYQVPYRLARAADAYRIAKDPEGGLPLTAEALELMELSEDQWFGAEVHRVRGELLLLTDRARDAESCLERALAAARRQNARLLELRAATSLARLWCDHGKRMEARDLLGPIYHWFTEGFDAPDLMDAKALLEQLTR